VVNTDLSDIPPEAIVGVRKVSIILEEEYLNQLKEELRELLGDKIDVMRADDGCLDIMAIGVTKGSALQHNVAIAASILNMSWPLETMKAMPPCSTWSSSLWPWLMPTILRKVRLLLLQVPMKIKESCSL